MHGTHSFVMELRFCTFITSNFVTKSKVLQQVISKTEQNGLNSQSKVQCSHQAAALRDSRNKN